MGNLRLKETPVAPVAPERPVPPLRPAHHMSCQLCYGNLLLRCQACCMLWMSHCATPVHKPCLKLASQRYAPVTPVAPERPVSPVRPTHFNCCQVNHHHILRSCRSLMRSRNFPSRLWRLAICS